MSKNRIRPRRKIAKLWSDLQSVIPVSFYSSEAFYHWLDDVGLIRGWELRIDYVQFARSGQVPFGDMEAMDNCMAILDALNGYLDKDNRSFVNMVAGLVQSFSMTHVLVSDLTMIKQDLAELGFDEESVSIIDHNSYNGRIFERHVADTSVTQVNHKNIMKKMESNTTPVSITDKKVFISHSSKDLFIIKHFVDDILKKGIGLRDENIVCTSFEATGVLPGDSIKDYIDANIKQSCIFLSMISSNYKSSEVCMNEVGAAWAVGNVPIQVVLPDTDFNSLGWLFNIDKAIRIDDEDALDSLMERICDRFGISVIKPKHWNPNKKDFLSALNSLSSSANNSNSE